MRNLYLLWCLSLLAACSNGRGSLDSEPQPPSGGAQTGFTVGGTISGLDGNGLVLQNNGGNDLAVANDGNFTFTGELANAAAYSVTVLTQPSRPSQTCTVANGAGTVAGANVTNVAITCATGAFALRGTVTALVGTGLVLQNNGGDDLPISAGGPFNFPSPIASGAAYSVTVLAQPTGPSQSCAVAAGSGTIGSADVTTVAVTCATGTFSIGVTVSGLVGSGLVLRNNGGGDLRINGNGTFQFGTLLTSGASYSVTVAENPRSPTQSCAVTNPSGSVGNTNITNIAINCVTGLFTVGGRVTGLRGSGLKLQLNDAADLTINPNGGDVVDFAFSTHLSSGTPYQVTVVTQPTAPSQNCVVTPATARGIVGGDNVRSVRVTCVTNTFSIGGTVSGLRGSGSGLVLQAIGGEQLAIASNGRFTFETKQESGTQYQVKVATQPTTPSQECSVARGSGTVGSGEVRDVSVTCSISSFTIGGTVTGLIGSGLALQNNGGPPLPVNADGNFVFKERVASGANYNVIVLTHPSNPTQACSTNGTGSGIVAGANITSVAISCSTSNFTIGGTVQGLAGSGLVLQNNGGDDLPISSDGSFELATAVPSGSPYNVTVATQPTGPTQECLVTNPSGTVGTDKVTNVAINCTTTIIEFFVGGAVSGLSGTGLTLQLNGANDLAIAASGPFTFPAALATDTSYSVTVATQPTTPAQTCGVDAAGVGIIAGVDVTTVQVTCVDDPPPP